MKLQALMVSLALAEAGCVPLKMGERRLEYRQMLLNNWIGSTAGELVDEWGPPDSTFERPDGAVVYTYERKTQIANVHSSSYAFGGDGYALGGSHGEIDPAGRVLCQNFFTIEGDEVVKASFKGPSCELFGWAHFGAWGPAVPEGGMLVKNVVPGSSAARFGIAPGMVVLKVDGAAISGYEDVSKVMGRHHAGDEIRVAVQVTPGVVREGVMELHPRPPKLREQASKTP